MPDLLGKTTEVDYIDNYIRKPKIDLKDRKILSVISKNCRLTPIQIGRQVGLSKGVVHYRIKKLEEKGIIRGYVTVLNPPKLGFMMFMLYLQTQNLSEKQENEFINRLIKHPSTHYITQCIGKFDFVLDILARSLNEFDTILRQILKESRKYIKHYEISPIIDVLKYVHLTESFSKGIHLKPAISISGSSFLKDFQHQKIDYTAAKIKLDEKDIQILYLLSNNAIIKLRKLEEKVGISSDAVKHRIKNLIKQNIILGFLPIVNISVLGYHTYAVLIELDNVAFEEKNKVLNYLESHPDVVFCLKTSSQYEIALNISIADNLHLHKFISKLKQNFAEQIKTIDLILVIKDYKIAFFPEGIARDLERR